MKMKITKRNGNITMYDEEKVVKSILKANAESKEPKMPESVAANIAETVFSELTEGNEIITTKEVRTAVQSVLCRKGYPETAKLYADYKKGKK